jgi:predicted dehydrogenase
MTQVNRLHNCAKAVNQESTAFWPGDAQRIEVHGTRGTAVMTGDRLTRWDVRDDHGPPPPLAEKGASGASDPLAISLTPFERQFEDFTSACSSGRAPLVDGNEGYRALALVDAIYRSCRSGERVALG